MNNLPYLSRKKKRDENSENIYQTDRLESDLEKINLGNVFSVNLSEKVKQAINIEIPETKQMEKQQDIAEIEENKFDEKELFTSLLELELSAINVEEDKKQEIAKDDDKDNDNQEIDNDKSAENKSEENEKV